MFKKNLFHGTEEQNLENIEKNGFIYKQRDNHWLGQGIYFFEDKKQAINWKTRNSKVVLEVTIELPFSEILDLDSIDGIEFFMNEVKEILQTSEIKIEIKEDELNVNRCFFLDIIKNKNKNINMIKYTFQISDPMYDKRNLKELQAIVPFGLVHNQLQYCLHKNEYIIEKKVIYREQPDSTKKVLSKRKSFKG